MVKGVYENVPPGKTCLHRKSAMRGTLVYRRCWRAFAGNYCNLFNQVKPANDMKCAGCLAALKAGA
jgi:hypothetical protein